MYTPVQTLILLTLICRSTQRTLWPTDALRCRPRHLLTPASFFLQKEKLLLEILWSQKLFPECTLASIGQLSFIVRNSMLVVHRHRTREFRLADRHACRQPQYPGGTASGALAQRALPQGARARMRKVSRSFPRQCCQVLLSQRGR